MNSELKLMALMNELMGTITQTGEWEERQMTDSQIKEAKKELDLVLKNVSHLIPYEIYCALEDSTINVACAYADAAILYGMQVANAIHTAVSNPNALSQHILNRIEARKSDRKDESA